jgi:hypothetical protein
MANLIEQLQADAFERSVPITDLLRKAKAAAVKLGRDDLSTWIELEMGGYLDGNDIPSYRILDAELKFLNPVRGWCPVVGATHQRPCRQSVGEVAALLESECDGFQVSVRPETVAQISKQIGFNVDVKSWVSRAALANIIESVRNTVLDWSLKLERAGVRGEGLSFSPMEAAKAQSVTINIGSIGTASGVGSFGDHATIFTTQITNVHAFADGVRALVDQIEAQLATLPQNVANSAKTVLAELREEASGKRPDEGILRRGLDSLGRIMEDATGNLVATGVIAAIAKLLS